MNNVREIEARHSTGVYGKRDLAIVRGEGSRVWDENGRPTSTASAALPWPTWATASPRWWPP
jgi:acetylornithine/succinyldiaminopimelate/putrescine aminotransferase